MLDEVDVTKSAAYANGAIEIQDLGSQLLLETMDLPAGGHWLDACAGAGGKTLQLAQRLGRAGGIDAFDVRPGALQELVERVARAGAAQPTSAPGLAPVKVLRTSPASGGTAYDGVLIDAPCSGSGTWRRAPHLKWTTNPKIVANRAAVQGALLWQYASSVRSGGLLVYATCSLARHENEAVIKAFLSDQPDFAVVPPSRSFGFTAAPAGLTILPARHDTDGFFVSTLRRR